MKILFVDACVRKNSRSRLLAERVLSHLSGTVEVLSLQQEGIMPLDEALMEHRAQLAAAGDFADPVFDYARQFAAADLVVMAAPYWDLSFSANLKAYIERICAVGLTFAYDPQDQPYGMVRVKEVIFTTTAGGPILSDAYGFGYLKAVMETFFEIPQIRQFKAQGLDLAGSDPDQIMEEAFQKIDREMTQVPR